jgi:hypothetical protein
MSGLKISQAFSMDEVLRDIDDFVMDQQQKTVIALSYIGDKIVTNAKRDHTFKTITGQLEASIGYQVLIEGEVAFEKTAGTGEGAEDAMVLFQELAEQDGVKLVIVAGKDYAAAVEARGYDVISNSIPEAKEVLQDLNKLLNE